MKTTRKSTALMDVTKIPKKKMDEKRKAYSLGQKQWILRFRERDLEVLRGIKLSLEL